MTNFDSDFVTCFQCGEEMYEAGDDLRAVNNGYVHENCLEEYFKSFYLANMKELLEEYSRKFAKEYESDFMEYVLEHEKEKF